MTGHPTRRAFTLIELLVVVAIIALLVSILLPALGRVKENGRRAMCLSNLHHLGQALQQYLNAYGDVLPVAAQMPSVDGRDPNDDFYHPPIMDFLEPFAGNLELFRCPSDMPGRIERDVTDPNHEGRSFWQTEDTSFEYTPVPGYVDDVLAGDGEKGKVIVGDTMVKVKPELPRESRLRRWLVYTSELYVLTEFETFHGKRGEQEVRNTLYADCHVEEYRHTPRVSDPNSS